MKFFSVLSLFALAAYLHIGFYSFKLESKSKINRMFLSLNIVMAIWSFAYAFVYASETDPFIWIKISAIGWCFFGAIILHIVFVFTESRILKHKFLLASIYIPGIILFYMSVFFFWPDKPASALVSNIFHIGDFLYNFSYLLISITLIYIWGIRSGDVRKRKQAKIIVISGVTPFVLNLLTQTILPLFGIHFLQYAGHLYSLILIFGIYYAVINYRLFSITANLFDKEIMAEMMDLVVLLTREGKILNVNKYTEQLLGYKEDELIGKTIHDILKGDEILNLIASKPSVSLMQRFQELHCVTNDGSLIPVSITCSLIIDPKLKDLLGIVLVGQDITLTKQLEQEIIERKEAEEYASFMAYHDSLTELPNRKFFSEKLNQELERASRKNEKFAVFFMDLDNFKAINDDYGHEAGDFLLCEIGRRIKKDIRESDIVARIGGDEFLLLILDIKTAEDAKTVAEKLLTAFEAAVAWEGNNLFVRASIGISIFPDDGDTAKLLINKADKNMYISKKEK